MVEENGVKNMISIPKTEHFRSLFSWNRSEARYIPGVATVTSIGTVIALLLIVPGSTITGWSVTANVSPVVAAGGLAQPVIGWFQFGLVRIYIPLISVLFVLAGELAAVRLHRFKILTGMIAGVTAGIQLLVISGCGCGDGTAGRIMTLLEQATAVGVL
jgi:hypothetical protein